MSEDNMTLDLSGKKKKMKSKIVTGEEAAADDDQLVLPEKKHKSNKTIQLNDDEQLNKQQDSLQQPPAMENDNTTLDLRGKKKKKAKIVPDEEPEEQKVTPVIEGLGRLNLIDAAHDWPDYTYDELLNMVFDIMREKNPDHSSNKKVLVMKPPNVARAGSKKTAFTNFSEICAILKRPEKHVLQFLLAELGTTGSIDGNKCLIVKGRFQQKHFESVLRKYIKEYVTCHTCRSSDTKLSKDTRLFFLECNVCESKCSVTAIKSGFTAMVGKRAALRRAAEATAGK